MHICQCLVFLCLVTFVKCFSCYWNTECKYKYFSSKTPYDLVRGDLRDSVKHIKGAANVSPISVWTLIRHGKRYPSQEYGRLMQRAIQFRNAIAENKSKEKSALCAQDVETLFNWNVDENMFNEPNGLTEEGYEETKGIGRRLREAFPKLMDTMTDGSYEVRPAFGDYIKKSAEGFAQGLRKNNSEIKIQKFISRFDYISPFSRCGKYLQDVRRNPKTFKHADLYQKKSEYLAMKNRIKQRTGIPYDLSHENITALYDLCRYSTSGSTFSPWCAIFTTEDLMILEYEGDLRQFYRNGYGHQWNIKLGAFPLANLFETFSKAAKGQGKVLSAYFTHSTVLDMVYSALGLFKDKEPLTAAKRIKDRKWRTSEMSTFASNIIAVLHRCEHFNETNYKVAFYLNERPLKELCDGGVCSWKEFIRIFQPFTNVNIDFCEFEAPLKLV